jgi:eukaryotic-like serine/threonine-protein kinase
MSTSTRSCPTFSEVLLHLQADRPAAPPGRVLTHIETCELCRLTVGEAAGAVSGDDRPPASNTLIDGDLVGRYRVRRILGRGGMGEVYEAFDEVLHEAVALKTVRLAMLDDAAALARFKSEVLLARRVSHPNVCRVLEFGLHGTLGHRGTRETIPYFTMELLDGNTLTAELRRAGPLPWAEAVALAAQLAAGLRAIHGAGIVHRDFKSDNVLIVAANGGRRAMVTDFGLARLDPARSAGSRRSSGVIVGTVDYMAPEQLRGESATVASDVFALGVVMFEMLTGRLPFAAGTRVGRALSRLGADAPPARRLVPGIPRAYARVLRRCLARDPARRYGNMDHLLAALAAIGPSATRPRIRLLAPAAALLVAAAALAMLRPRARPTHPIASPAPIDLPAPPRPAPSAPALIDLLAPPRAPSAPAPIDFPAAAPASPARTAPARVRRRQRATARQVAPAAEMETRDRLGTPDFSSAPPGADAADQVLTPAWQARPFSKGTPKP